MERFSFISVISFSWIDIFSFLVAISFVKVCNFVDFSESSFDISSNLLFFSIKAFLMSSNLSSGLFVSCNFFIFKEISSFSLIAFSFPICSSFTLLSNSELIAFFSTKSFALSSIILFFSSINYSKSKIAK